MDEFCKAVLNLDELIKEKGISKTQLSYKAEISHTQINRFCKNDVTRIDLITIARLCQVLNCSVSDLIKYEPPVYSRGFDRSALSNPFSFGWVCRLL